jgi:hypothetical protein
VAICVSRLAMGWVLLLWCLLRRGL